jgi:cytochrome c oxidase cbb3-type subunit 4
MSYEAFRQFADSWGLLFMALTWLFLALWAFRPSAKQHHRDAANMIFDESENDGR